MRDKETGEEELFYDLLVVVILVLLLLLLLLRCGNARLRTPYRSPYHSIFVLQLTLSQRFSDISLFLPEPVH